MGIYGTFLLKWSFNISFVPFVCMISWFEVKKEEGQVYDMVLNAKMEGYEM
jgi:hypothetical protein